MQDDAIHIVQADHSQCLWAKRLDQIMMIWQFLEVAPQKTLLQ